MEKITIHNIEPATRKDGTHITGKNSKGNPWTLWKINNKYSFFHHGEGEPNFEVGNDYDFDVEVKEKDGFTNYTLSFPKKGGSKKDGLDDVRVAYAELKKRQDELEAEFKLLKEFLNNS